MLLHLCVICVVFLFDVSIYAKAFLSISLLIISWVQIKRHYVSMYTLTYQAKTNTWAIAEIEGNYEQYTDISKIFVNEWFVWIVLKQLNITSRGIFIGRDSLPSERFVQLRRCILCPDIIYKYII